MRANGCNPVGSFEFSRCADCKQPPVSMPPRAKAVVASSPRSHWYKHSFRTSRELARKCAAADAAADPVTNQSSSKSSTCGCSVQKRPEKIKRNSMTRPSREGRLRKPALSSFHFQCNIRLPSPTPESGQDQRVGGQSINLPDIGQELLQCKMKTASIFGRRYGSAAVTQAGMICRTRS
jgi:hypothetical protein